jgi:hypothetical protein
MSIMANNALQSLIQVLHRNGAVIVESLTHAFENDYSQFARSNNRDPLNVAVKTLNKSKQDTAISNAISVAHIAGVIPVGYIGAVTGKYAAQPEHVREKYEGAIVLAVAAFKKSLIDSKVFEDKTPKTEEEKIKAKQEQAEKKQALLDDHVNSLIVAGELTRTKDIKHGDLGQAEITDKVVSACKAGMFLKENAELLVIAMREQFPELFTEQAKPAKTAKPAKPAKVAVPA